MLQWLALLPHSKKVHSKKAFLYVVCMLSPCLDGFSLIAFSTVQRHAVGGFRFIGGDLSRVHLIFCPIQLGCSC